MAMNWILMDNGTARNEGWDSAKAVWRYDYVDENCKVQVIADTESDSVRPEDSRRTVGMRFIIKRTKGSSFHLFKTGYEYIVWYKLFNEHDTIRHNMMEQFIEGQIQGIIHYMSQKPL